MRNIRRSAPFKLHKRRGQLKASAKMTNFVITNKMAQIIVRFCLARHGLFHGGLKQSTSAIHHCYFAVKPRGVHNQSALQAAKNAVFLL